MDRTMCSVGGELTQMESLIYNTLSSKSSITMYQNGHHLEHNDFIMARCDNAKTPTCLWYLFSFSISSIELLSFGFALNDWIHSLKVGRVRHERQRDVLVGFAVNPLMVHPKVVLDIA